MKILFGGDVVGRAGRKVVLDLVPQLRAKWNLDLVVINGENASHGFGLTPKNYTDFLAGGVDVVTLGNHSFDKKEVFAILDEAEFLVRPLNYPENTSGHGFCIKALENGKRVAVVQLLGKLYMRPQNDPFEEMNAWLKKYDGQYDVLIVDYHAEATAEKAAFGWFMDGKAALVAGTHTHIPTADALLLKNGTGYMTDVGMCGDYHSVIGMQVSGSLSRFLIDVPTERLSPAEESATFCGVVVEIDDVTNRTTKIFPVRIGTHLENTHDL